MSISEENRVAAALNQLEKSNLSSACSAEELRKLVEDYFCTAGTADTAKDSDSDSEDYGDYSHEDEFGESDGRNADGGTHAARKRHFPDEDMQEIAVNMRQCRVDEASDLLAPASADYVNNDIDTEMTTVKEYMCNCQLNSGEPCYTQFHHDEVIRRRMAMQELSSGMYNVCTKLKNNYYSIENICKSCQSKYHQLPSSHSMLG